MKTPIFYLLFCILSLNMGTASIAASPSVDISEKTYAKEFYSNGKLKSEGWQSMNTKTDFWIYYHPNGEIAAKGHYSDNKKNGYWHFYDKNGKLEKEGHYVMDSAENWWIFYDIANRKTSKFQYKNNQKNGFGLRYNKRKLVRAERYKNDKKDGEWTSIVSFKRDNPDVSLR
ncbi:hypothetical protein POV27_02775 [Aureisphaera galaxeae]|uniref:toxin-antitoxin system YwqK family antitoxin n=1 Tax=Aureisphaera galaxeae TaxID=1538023 RepID=UPI0023509F58|nr:hypothetical protein [Aureisphaera galaxeae]MDC8002956.1 hypothetical protein [Aureisphaera galaxeae]